MKLTSLIGNLTPRSPGVAISSTLKVIYITYNKLRNPKKVSAKFDSPVPNEDVSRIFKELMIGWGIDTKDWHLCIDARDEYFLPHEDIPDVLSSFNFKDITIFCNSIKDTDVPYIIETHPTACIILSHWYDILQEQTINWEQVNWDRHFIILARKPTLKRVNMVKHMLDHYKDHTICSCGSSHYYARRTLLARSHGKGPRRKPITVRLNKNPSATPRATKDNEHYVNQVHHKVNFAELMSPHPYPISIEDGSKLIITEFQGRTGTDYNFFNNAVNIVCETMEEDWQQINLSEKTFKPFAWHQLPIWHASPGTVTEVRKLGFDVFDDIFDHSYDSMTQYDIKKEFLLNQINLFYEKYDTLDKLTNLKQELLPRLQANNERVLYWVNEEKKLIDKVLLNVA
jgi:hypothetical protein